MRCDVPRIGAPGGQEPAFRADLRTAQTMKDQGWNLFPAATPPVVNRGITLNGSTQYAVLCDTVIDPAFMRGPSDELSIVMEFTPTAGYDSATQYTFYDSLFSAGWMYLIKFAAPGNDILGVLNGGAFINLTSAVYGPLWTVGSKMQFVIYAKTASVQVRINGVEVANGAVGGVVTKTVRPTLFQIGRRQVSADGFFPGVIHSLDFYNRKLSAAEVLAL
jgi:hypothetical protein